MNAHGLSQDDRDFRSGFEACTVPPSAFTHAAHVRLAYVYLVENDVEGAVQKMREALLSFIDHNGVPRSKFHETITRAWVLAVRHFMNKSASVSSADFMAKNPELLDSKIMRTHYSASVLFSPDARAAFVEPDLDPIPPRGERPVPGGGAENLHRAGGRRPAARRDVTLQKGDTMSDWKPYDPAWLVELAKEQVPEETWLPAALAACTMAKQESAAYIHFVNRSDPDEAGSEWEVQTDFTLKHPTEGDVIVDVLEGNRIGGVEFPGKL